MGGPEDCAARSAATFRDANERIFASARAYRVSDEIPFLCECADRGCTAIVRLSAAQYERIREDATRFFNARGHAAAFHDAVEVVERHPGYEVVVKTGRAAEVAEELDPRPRS